MILSLVAERYRRDRRFPLLCRQGREARFRGAPAGQVIGRVNVDAPSNSAIKRSAAGRARLSLRWAREPHPMYHSHANGGPDGRNLRPVTDISGATMEALAQASRRRKFASVRL